jgi:hypothetical protein
MQGVPKGPVPNKRYKHTKFGAGGNSKCGSMFRMQDRWAVGLAQVAFFILLVCEGLRGTRGTVAEHVTLYRDTRVGTHCQHVRRAGAVSTWVETEERARDASL